MSDWRHRAAEAERRAWRLVAVVLAVCVAWGSCLIARASEPELALIHLASECGCDPWVAQDLLRLEELAGARAWGWPVGGLLAQACHESRCTSDALGDWRVSKRGRKVARAVGYFQLWSWAERQGADRRHHLSAGEVYLETIRRSLKHVRRHCGKVRRPWRVAWIRVNRGPKWRTPERIAQQRCHGADPGGLKVLKRWRRQALKRWPERALAWRGAGVAW